MTPEEEVLLLRRVANIERVNKLQGERMDRLSARIRILEDAAVDPSPPPPPPPPPPVDTLAPRTYNISNSGDARFCVKDLPTNNNGQRYEPSNPSITYDTDGRSLGPGRNPNRIVPGIKASDMMDDKGPCDPYEWEGRTFPPWPPESYLP